MQKAVLDVPEESASRTSIIAIVNKNRVALISLHSKKEMNDPDVLVFGVKLV